MTNRLVESIPNFSEGRRTEVVRQISEVILSVKDVTILDQHSDHDHNRTVITLLGSPEGVSEALFCSIQKAAELIDMNEHQGEHPRIGAADVVPFVPIRGISMRECVELAKALGRRVGDELGIPVYLYEEAAASPERVNLENIRKGQYESLKTEIEKDPARKPDYGPSKMGSAGAVVIGAREALIAFNVFLNTDDVAIAKAIAKTIRHSSGGLRYVKAMGVLVDGRAQVSMNLTNFRKTPIAQVVETIRREAQRYGTLIHHSELIGLVPQEALLDAAVWYTQLDGFETQQVLENRLTGEGIGLSEARFAFLDELASNCPTPGGGSAAAFAAAQAAALLSMVARVTIGKQKYASVEGEMKTALEKSESLREKLTELIDRDAQAFDDLMKVFKLPRETEQEQSIREQGVYEASIAAAGVPWKTAGYVVQILELALVLIEKGNLNAITDAGTGAALCMAAIAGAGANVRINLSAYPEDPQSRALFDKIGALEDKSKKLYSAIQEKILDRAKINLA